MATLLETLRAKLNASAPKTGDQPKSRNTGDNASFPFWDAPDNTTTSVRFLLDGDETNDFFWAKREVIKLPFSGVVGGDYPTEKDVSVTVPCVDMFGMKCPIIAATKHLWDNEATKDLARVYYKKRSFIFQGFVLSSPLNEETVPENPIRRFVINKSIYDKIYDAIIDLELTEMPTDYEGGRDFSIKKTKKGQYANYDTSKFSINSRSLNEAERAAIDKFGLFNLKESLGAIPSPDHLEAMKAMLKDSMDGNPFDMESYGQYYRPYSAGASTPRSGGAPSTYASKAQADVAESIVAEAPSVQHNAAMEVLKNLRNRTQTQ